MTMNSLLIATALSIISLSGSLYASHQDELPEGFDARAYVQRYQDLSTAFDAQHDVDLFTFAKNHYLRNGLLEGREARGYGSLGLPADFKEETYLFLNPDIADYARLNGHNPVHFAIAHFLSSGQKENRLYKAVSQSQASVSVVSLPDDFDADTYFALNPDVAEVAIAQKLDPHSWAKEHYLTNGRKEKRLYRMPLPFSQAVSSSLPVQPTPSLQEELGQALSDHDEARVNEILDILHETASDEPSAIPPLPTQGIFAHHPHYQEPSASMVNPAYGPSYAPKSYSPEATFDPYGATHHALPTQSRDLEAELNEALDQRDDERVRRLTQEMAIASQVPSFRAHVGDAAQTGPGHEESLQEKLERAMAEGDERAVFRLLNDNDDQHAPKPTLVRDMAKAFEEQSRGGNADQHQILRANKFDHRGRFVSGEQRDPHEKGI